MNITYINMNEVVLTRSVYLLLACNFFCSTAFVFNSLMVYSNRIMCSWVDLLVFSTSTI